MSGGVQKRWLSVKSRIIRSYFEKKPISRKKSKKVKKRIKLLQYDKKIHLPGEDHTRIFCWGTPPGIDDRKTDFRTIEGRGAGQVS